MRDNKRDRCKEETFTKKEKKVKEESEKVGLMLNSEN